MCLPIFRKTPVYEVKITPEPATPKISSVAKKDDKAPISPSQRVSITAIEFMKELNALDQG